MATPIAMPRQGNTVESCVIQQWFKKKGDAVAKGEPLFSYETDKASFEFEAPVSGTLLEIFFEKDQDVPVLTNVAVIGEPGENSAQFTLAVSAVEAAPVANNVVRETTAASNAAAPAREPETVGVSPRARNLASGSGVELANVNGTGPKGRIIERDIRRTIDEKPLLTKTAKAIVEQGALFAPAVGTGLGGRIRLDDLTAQQPADISAAASTGTIDEEVKDVVLSNMRKIIGARMMESLQQSAQLTMHASANATGLLAYRQLVKSRREELDLADITITDLVVFAVSRVLPRFPEINALLANDKLTQFTHAHVALAVDTPRGLMVPVVRNADLLSLNDIAKSCKSVAKQCQDGTINPDRLSGGTFTISNLGSFGVEFFTPVLNRPQVGLLGVNTIQPKPLVDASGGYTIAPHIGLSLTIDHRALDGASGARFLKALVAAIDAISLTLSL